VKIDMQGRGAIVMAGSQGLGRGIARALAAAGARVAIGSRDPGRIEEAARAIADETGAEVRPFVVDVSVRAQVEAFVRDAAAWLGGVDMLITNAGGPAAGAFEDLTDEQWLAAVDGNLLSVARAVRAALPHMKGRPGASITCVVSSSVKVPIPHLALSNALRPAIVGLAKTLSQELAAEGIRVNCLAPGRIDTERVRHLDRVHAAKTGTTPEAFRATSEASIPFGRYGDVAEFADVALFLASDAARYVTGQTIFVDGGLVRTLM